MTTELGPASRALLDAARGGLGPDPAAIARMRGRIDHIAAAGVSAVGSAPAAASITSSKLGLVGLVAIAVGIGAGVASRHSVAGEPLTAIQPTELPAGTVHTVREVAPVASETDLIELEAPAKPIVRPRAKSIDLKREVELVDRAMVSLRGGDPSAALVAVRLHATETAGAGQLAEDATAIEIEALCKLHDPAASGRLAAFDARWPSSAQRARLTSNCP